LIVNRLDPIMVQRGEMMTVEDVADILAIDVLGVIPNDEEIISSTNRGEPVALDDESISGQAFRNTAARIDGDDVPLMVFDEPESAWRRLMRALRFGGGKSVPAGGGGTD
jgi:septum site-determining protein MinD